MFKKFMMSTSCVAILVASPLKSFPVLAAVTLGLLTATSANAGLVGSALSYFESALEEISSANSIATDNLINSSAKIATADLEVLLSGAAINQEMLEDPKFLKTLVDKIYDRKTTLTYDTTVLSDLLNVMNFALDTAQLTESLTGVVKSGKKLEGLVNDIAAMAKSGNTEPVDLIIAASRSGTVAWDSFKSTSGLSKENVEVIEALISDQENSVNIDNLISLAALQTLEDTTAFLAAGKPSDVRRFTIQEAVLSFVAEFNGTLDISNQEIYQPDFEGRLIFNDWSLTSGTIGNSASYQSVSSSIYTDFTIEPTDTSTGVNTTPSAGQTAPEGSVTIGGGFDNEVIEADLCRWNDCENLFKLPEPRTPSEEPEEIETLPEIVITNPIIEDPTEPTIDRDRIAQRKREILDDFARRQQEPGGETNQERFEREQREKKERDELLAEQREREEAERQATENRLLLARAELLLQEASLVENSQERATRVRLINTRDLTQLNEITGPVLQRISDLRGELQAGTISDANRLVLQDLLRYETVLEQEQERVADELATAQRERDQYFADLRSVRADLQENQAALANVQNDLSDYVAPTYAFPGVRDWSGYTYELPEFVRTDPDVEPDTGPVVVGDSNIVGWIVLPPREDGNTRLSVALVSEDKTLTLFASNDIDPEDSEGLDGFNHIRYGENDDGTQWLYGAAATPEQFATRTGTADFKGGFSGYFQQGFGESAVTTFDGVGGDLTLEINFNDDTVAGNGTMIIDTPDVQDTFEFGWDPVAVSNSSTGITRAIKFSALAERSDQTSSGLFDGEFFGADASEAAGSFSFGTTGGLATGLWAAGENAELAEDSYNPVIVSYSNLNGGITDRGDQGTENVPGLGDNLTLTIDGTPTTVTSVSNVRAGDFSYTSMGQWTGGSPSSPINTGYWVSGEGTRISGLEVKTGSATYAGDIIGDFVSYAETQSGSGTREGATGTIRLTADFSRDLIDGEMQFVSEDTATEIIALTSPISNSGQFFESNDVDFDRPVYAYGFSGKFFGPTATEAGGSVWAVTEDGSYNGVFRAGEDLSFGGFVTPTTTDMADLSNPTDYSNYRGLLGYAYSVSGEGLDLALDFAALEDIDNQGEMQFEGADTARQISASKNTGEYDHLEWGSWRDSGSDVFFAKNGETRDLERGRWVVYEPTPDLQRTGTAEYSGEIHGVIPIGSSTESVEGQISLTADFKNDRVDGNLNAQIDGSPWVSSSFDTSITRDTDSSGFQGALTGSNVANGVIFGGFAGPNAEEVGGGWSINANDGLSANGIFRAKQ